MRWGNYILQLTEKFIFDVGNGIALTLASRLLRDIDLVAMRST